jgi:GT2 family glycosyltransferase
MVSVIIPNYNGEKHLRECLDSLKIQSFDKFDIIIVDNNSSDKSVDIINNEYSFVKLINMTSNSGFSKAVNTGIRFALKNSNIKYIILLNNDIKCDKDFIKELISGFSNSDTGSVASKMMNFYNTDIIDDAGDFINKKGLPTARGNKKKDSPEFNKEKFIFSACAGAAAYSREVFEIVGLFDEDFFAYYEDIDFSYRMQLAGYKCYYNPKAFCYHKRGATFSSRGELTTMLCEKNLVALRLKNYPVSLLFKYQYIFFFSRIVRYYRFWRDHSFKVFVYAVRGYLKGLWEIPKNLKKRKMIQKNRNLNSRQIENLLKLYAD